MWSDSYTSEETRKNINLRAVTAAVGGGQMWRKEITPGHTPDFCPSGTIALPF